MLRWLKTTAWPSIKQDWIVYVAILLFALWSFASTSAQAKRNDESYKQGYKDGFYDGYWKSQGEHGVY